MRDHNWQIAIFGTFDVENYGDLLFPLIAEAELAERLGAVELHRFSYHARTPPDWPYTVTSVTELPQIAGSLDGALIGGGFIMRFDKEVAPGYGPPTPHSGTLEAECVTKQRRIDELSKLLALARAEIVARDNRIATLYDSPSMRVTASLRFLMRSLKRLLGK
jgi:hypothetical protein